MMSKWALLLFLSLSVGVCLGNSPRVNSHRILKGNRAAPGRFGYQVSIQSRGKNVCGGAIVDEQYVVTAAHCFANSSAYFYNRVLKVVAGVVDLNNRTSPGRVVVDIEKVYLPMDFFEKYDKFKHTIGDIAVAKLQAPLNFTKNPLLKKLRLPTSNATSYDDETAVVTGFGWNWINMMVDNSTGGMYEDGGGDRIMRYAFANVVNLTHCRAMYVKAISEKHICAQIWERGDEIDGVCDGDSGGPLVWMDKTLIGVVRSSPLLCNERRKPSLYTRITSYLDFINKAMKNISDPRVFSVNFSRGTLSVF